MTQVFSSKIFYENSNCLIWVFFFFLNVVGSTARTDYIPS